MSSSADPPKGILLNQIHKRGAIFEIINAKYIDDTANLCSVPCLIANGGLRLDLFSEDGGTLTHINRFELGFSCATIHFMDYSKEIPGNRRSTA